MWQTVTPLLFSFLVIGSASAETLYTKSNIWVHKNKASVINYQTGALIKLGTKVEIVDTGNKFSEVQITNGPLIRFYNHRATGLSMDEALDTFFGANPRPKLKKLSAKDQKLVKKGKVKRGMSKDAVLLSLGPPPPHKTPSLDGDDWLYWKSKFSKYTVVFEDGVVVDIDDGKKKAPVAEKKEKKDIRWASSNVFTDKGEEISWVNYLRGPVIPFGTKIEVLDIDDDEVEFKVVNNGKEYSFTNEESRSGYPAKDLFKRVFSKTNPKSKLKALKKKEQRRVKGAKVKTGMSREAVLMAVGPPPPHATPSLESDEWTYWKTRYTKMLVTFDDDGNVESVK